jgi:DNA-binding NarL/FixJ family response regulator
MSSNKPYFSVLCTELPSVRAIADAVGRAVEICWAGDAQSLRAVTPSQQHAQPPIAVMVDNSIPQINAIELLEAVRVRCPTSRRLLLSDYCDLGIIVQGLHTGAVQGIVYKPIYAPELLAALGVQQVNPAASRAAMHAAACTSRYAAGRIVGARAAG